MSRTVTALYDTRAEAEAARERLSAQVDLGSARILDQQSHAGGADGSLNRVPLPHEDRSAFHEGIRRGGFLLTAEVRSHEEADTIIRLLEESASVDLDSRQEQWRRDGWSPAASGAARQRATGGAPPEASGSEQVVPIVEEDLVVGRREVERGGARVRSYVREVPVHEQVTLREEHVSVERRPIDQPLGSADLDEDLLRERDVELTAKGEEPVVTKEAHVREEVVVTKVAEQRVAQVDAHVARTQVALDTQPPAGVSPMAGNASSDIPSTVETRETHETTSSSALPASSTSLPVGGPAPAMAPPPVQEKYAVEEVRTPGSSVELVGTRRRQSSRPSTALVIGSAVAGAIAGSVIPFLLVGRKSGKSGEVLLIEDHSPSLDARGDASLRGGGSVAPGFSEAGARETADAFPRGGRRY